MNYLAHIYLSGEEKGVLTGNFMGDHVKGKAYDLYPPSIRKGILLHRQIDSFTDSHSHFRAAKKMLREDYGLYSGIVTDLFYDHFLARNWKIYSLTPIREFTQSVHAVLISYFFFLPAKVQGFLPFLIKNRRLESYATIKGIKDSLDIMSRHTSLPANTEKAIRILQENYISLENDFHGFMQDIINFVETIHGIILSRGDTPDKVMLQACIR